MSAKSFKSLYKHFVEATTRPKITAQATATTQASLEHVPKEVFDDKDVNPVFKNFCDEGIAHFAKPSVPEETKQLYEKAIEDYLVMREAAKTE